jgi:hypothetical protein
MSELDVKQAREGLKDKQPATEEKFPTPAKPTDGSRVVKLPGVIPVGGNAEDKAVGADLAAYQKAGGGMTGGLFTYTPDLKGYKDMLADEAAILQEQKKIVQLKADLLFPTEDEKKQIRADIPQADRSALDYLLNNAPTQLEKPEVNAKQQAIELMGTAMVMAGSSIANYFTSKTGTTVDPGARVAGELYPAQLERINLTEQQRRDIELKQAAIDIQYRNDVVAAKQAFDADQDETAKAYLMQENMLIARKTQDYMNAYGMLQDTKGRVLALTGDIYRAQSTADMFNIGQKQDASKERAAVARDMARFAIDSRKQYRLESKLSQDRVFTLTGGETARVENNLADNIGGIPISQTNNMLAIMGAQSSDPQMAEALSLGFQVHSAPAGNAGLAAYSVVKGMVDGGVITSAEQQAKLSQDIGTFVQLYNVAPTPEIIATIKDYPFTPAGQGDEIRVPKEVIQMTGMIYPQLVPSFQKNQSMTDTYDYAPQEYAYSLKQIGTIDIGTGNVKTPDGLAWTYSFMRGYNTGVHHTYGSKAAQTKAQIEANRAAGK